MNKLVFEFACDGLFQYAQIGFFIDEQPDDVAVDFGHLADYAGTGDYFHTFAKTLDEFLLIFLPLHLGPDQEKIKDYNNKQGK